MPVLAYVLVKTKPGTSHELIASRKITNVRMADSVFGKYDAVLVIEADDMEDLSNRVYDVVEKHPNVEHTEVLVSIPWSPPEEETPPSERDVHFTFNCPSCNTLNEQGATYCHFCGFVFQQPGGRSRSRVESGQVEAAKGKARVTKRRKRGR